MKEQTPKLCIHCHCPIGRCEWGCINYKDMSKEQTPITAEEIIDELIDIIKNPQNSNKEWVEAIIITAKEYDSNKVINAKVLEALERVNECFTGSSMEKIVRDIIETEVKPKYE